MGKNVTFCSARYNFKTCAFASGVFYANGVLVVQQYCHRAMSVSSDRLCQFILDLIRCRNGSDDDCILDRKNV